MSSPSGSVPPPVDPTAVGAPDAPQPRREFRGWAVLACLFALALVNSFLGGSRPEQARSFAKAREARLKQGVRARELGERLGNLGGGSTGDTVLPELEREADAARAKDPDAAALFAAVRFEQGKPLPGDLAPQLAKRPAFAEVYGPKKPDSRRAQQLADQLKGESGFLGKLAAAHAGQRAGLPDPRAGLGRLNVFGALVVGLGLMLIVLVGVVGWLLFAVMRPRPLGLPYEPAAVVDADRLALRGAQLFGAFLFLTTLNPLLARAVGGVGAQLTTVALMLLAVAGLFRLPMGGRRLTLADLGVRSDDWPRDVGIGILAFCMELPVVAALAVTITVVTKANPSHPVQETLMSSPGPMAVLAVFLLGAVLAPFWEELFFRGTLFPALAKVAGGRWIGAFASSLLFAAIHPQGPALWAALGGVGLMGCALMYYTRSLVPAIAMHAAHNASLLTMSLLIF